MTGVNWSQLLPFTANNLMDLYVFSMNDVFVIDWDGNVWHYNGGTPPITVTPAPTATPTRTPSPTATPTQTHTPMLTYHADADPHANADPYAHHDADADHRRYLRYGVQRREPERSTGSGRTGHEGLGGATARSTLFGAMYTPANGAFQFTLLDPGLWYVRSATAAQPRSRRRLEPGSRLPDGQHSARSALPGGADPDADADKHARPIADTDSNTYAHANTDAHCDTDTDADTLANARARHADHIGYCLLGCEPQRLAGSR